MKISAANMAVWKDPKTGRVHWNKKHASGAALTSLTYDDYLSLRVRDLVCRCLLDVGFIPGRVAD